MKIITGTITFLLMISLQVTQANQCTSATNKTLIPDVQLETIASNLDYPVHIANDGFHKNRLYIVEQDGLIQIINIIKIKY